MWDVRVAELAGRQFNRISTMQLFAAGLDASEIARWVRRGRLVAEHEGVYALAPLLPHDDWGRWMGATLTAPGTFLSHASASAARGMWTPRQQYETVTRVGSGGPRRHGRILVFRSSTLTEADRDELNGIPITSVPRTLLDLAGSAGPGVLARALREALRLKLTTLPEVADACARHRGRRGVAALRGAVARYSGLPLERARSGAEVRALEVLREAGPPLPRLNVRIAGAEADLVWPQHRLIVEIDGDPFHLDKGEDARKEDRWTRAGWTVRRLRSSDVYERPERLIALASPPNVPE